MIALAFIAGLIIGPYTFLALISYASDAELKRGQFTRWQMLKRALVWPLEMIREAWND